MTASTLTPLQRDLLDAFFRRAKGFYLTGGAALAGFYLGHRETADLDFFTGEPILEDGETALRGAVSDLKASLENVQTAPDFRRRLVRRGEESVIVDLVRDQAPHGPEPTRAFGIIQVDPPSEILANKLCTLLSRCEPRDLVDVLFLERAGHRIEDVLPVAQSKDGGLTPAQLAWVLSQIRIGDEARIPGGLRPAELRDFLADLQRRLTQLAFPQNCA